jgi:hypothetical protein
MKQKKFFLNQNTEKPKNQKTKKPKNQKTKKPKNQNAKNKKTALIQIHFFTGSRRYFLCKQNIVSHVFFFFVAGQRSQKKGEEGRTKTDVEFSDFLRSIVGTAPSSP